jgi:pimeloyl-ACP methyl ester carboxylesterase
MAAVMTVSKFPALEFHLPKGSRHLAYSSVGDAHSPHVLLCLPGLLETRATFDPLLQTAEGVQGLRVISLDLCGRGDSSPLPSDKGYTMQVYLEDIVHFMRAELMLDGKPVPHIDVLGTSMGGILAMYLAHEKSNHVSGLFFNDIGLDLPWMSIYGLYDGMKKAGRLPTPEEMAEQFNVSIGAVLAVQSPSHFDLPYRKDWKGMKFGHLLNDFKGPVRLMHGSDSGVCTPQQVKELQREFPKAQVLEVAGAAHPVPFNAMVNQFVLQALHLPVVTPAKSEPVREASVQQMQQMQQTQQTQQMPMPFDTPAAAPQPKAIPEPVAEPEPVKPTAATVQQFIAPRAGLLGLLKQLLGATKK